MAEPGNLAESNRDNDVVRVAEEVSTRLRARGVEVLPTDTPTDLALLLDAVEDFELAIEARGGDLMTAEPPGGQSAEPTDLVLPARSADEPPNDYATRLTSAARQLRERAD